MLKAIVTCDRCGIPKILFNPFFLGEKRVAQILTEDDWLIEKGTDAVELCPKCWDHDTWNEGR